MTHSFSEPICSLGQLAVVDCVNQDARPSVPPELARYFQGVKAHREWASDPTFDHRTGITYSSDSRVFCIWKAGERKPLRGAVLVTDISNFHRRACVHVSVIPEARDRATAKAGLTMVGAVMGESFGIEKFWTYVQPDSHGLVAAKDIGLDVEGQLRGHALTPWGREDTLILGGLWSDLRQRLEADLQEIVWHS